MVVKKLLALLLTRLSAVGTVYTASWTATSTNANNVRVTNKITLPKGTYMFVLKCPVCSQEAALAFTVNPFGTTNGGMFARGQSVVTTVQTLSQLTEVYAETAMSQATTYTYTERAYLTAVRIA
jgi:hypothetical protein